MQQPSPEIRPGDIVVLKSGGPAMSVRACSQNLAYCSWVDGGAVQSGTFALDTLLRQDSGPEPIQVREAAANDDRANVPPRSEGDYPPAPQHGSPEAG